ncbi:MAG: hypothetical protein CVU63_14985 [Deltaproteobacteria bacterium HGW-Deltaproteobacteria-20]|nr:MAG: hypothetical protein CVU63_14985 [Deltaproteobacteria bacterium HGW-Deltaproteobacteria-20]
MHEVNRTPCPASGSDERIIGRFDAAWTSGVARDKLPSSDQTETGSAARSIQRFESKETP